MTKITELKKKIKRQAEFINIASMENPMNMGAEQTKLDDMKDELEGLKRPARYTSNGMHFEGTQYVIDDEGIVVEV